LGKELLEECTAINGLKQHIETKRKTPHVCVAQVEKDVPKKIVWQTFMKSTTCLKPSADVWDLLGWKQ
jgi:hypothetical protein